MLLGAIFDFSFSVLFFIWLIILLLIIRACMIDHRVLQFKKYDQKENVSERRESMYRHFFFISFFFFSLAGIFQRCALLGVHNPFFILFYFFFRFVSLFLWAKASSKVAPFLGFTAFFFFFFFFFFVSIACYIISFKSTPLPLSQSYYRDAANLD